jgi:hypothetical protein
MMPIRSITIAVFGVTVVSGNRFLQFLKEQETRNNVKLNPIALLRLLILILARSGVLFVP